MLVVAAASCLVTRCLADDLKPAGEIRKLESQHLRLFTDLRSSPAVDELPAVFDAAFPQWCEYFQLDAKAHSDWHCDAFLMRDKAAFARAGMLPAELPLFLNGYTRQSSMWINEQASDYYQRHLLLHEGTHAYMFQLLGGAGPPWYAEGLAELLATHRWQDGKLTLRYFPRSAAEAPKLGRVEIVQTEFAVGRALHLTRVMQYDTQAHLKNEPYGWCWAAAALLDGHPKYQQRFRTLPKLVKEHDFNAAFSKLFADDLPQLSEEWQVFAADMCYGYDFARCQIDFRPGQALPAAGQQVSVAADRGWQNSGLLLEGGRTYQLTASGRFQLADKPKPWISEPAGISIRYRHGQPLGSLQAAVRREPPAAGVSGLLKPTTIGAAGSVSPAETGTLYLRLNDFPGELDDNSGAAEVSIKLR